MADTVQPPTPGTSSELLKLARRIERFSAQRRRLLEKVAELETNIRAMKSLFRQIADSIAPAERVIPPDLTD